MTHDFAAMWPIVDQADPDLFVDAAASLAELVEGEHLAQAGHPTFTRGREHITARVPVHIEEADDPRPWESRRAFADAELDWIAA